ncbi:MAG: DUF2851 family protein [Chloroflexi bacterium]|nr:DUF2851 family protein [Chloroflexota bacterium]
MPTLPLRDYLNGSMDDLAVRAESHQIPSLLCQRIGERLGEERLGEILDEYGIERFYLKSASFEIDLIIEEPEQVIYQRLMGALGYTKNKKAFEELAQRLPYRVIESIIREQEPVNRTLMLQALLLGSAGLLPSQCDGKSKLSRSVEISNLERTWDLLSASNSMSYADWHFFRMHPKNFPTSRLLAAGYLLDSYLEEGLLKQLLNLVREANPGKYATKIERGFIVPDLLGQGRAREITVNVVLPFFYSWAQMNAQDEIKKHVSELYGAYPRLGENQITRYLNELFWGNVTSGKAKSAKRQQGMIHLYKTFCQDQRCDRCPVIIDESPNQDQSR